MPSASKKVLNVAIDAAQELFVFSKLERIVAAVSMGIPFFLILADVEERIGFWSIFFGTLTISAIPLIVSLAAYWINDMNKRRNEVLTFFCAFFVVMLFFYFWYLTLRHHFTIRDSISSYVSMKNAQIFGLLLTTASMLFIFNGAIYINKVGENSSKWHGKWYNLVLGVCLLCVVLFPCTNPHLKYLHYGFAILFFGGSAFVIAFFNDRKHRTISAVIAGVCLLSFAVYLLNTLWLHSQMFTPLTLFWAETVSLWVIGIHYILESLGELR